MVMHHRRLTAPTPHQLTVYFILVTVTVASFSVHMKAQSDIPEIETQSTESGTSVILDDLDYVRQHPLDLLRTPVNELTALPGINARLVQRMRHILKQHTARSLEDLCQELQLTDEQRYSVLTFMRVSRETTGAGAVTDPDFIILRLRASQALEQQRGYRTAAFSGGPLDCTNRLNVKHGSLEGNVLVSKDAGESSYADFASAYLQLESTGETRIIVGDFSIDAGLGSVYSRSLSGTKSSSSVSPLLRLGSGLHAYHSSMDYHFFRGAAAQTSMRFDSTEYRCFAFVSTLQRSASIDSVTGFVSTLDISGLHRSSSELLRRRCLGERSFGAGLECRSGSFTIGINLLGLGYDHVFENNSSLFATKGLRLFSSAFASFSDDRLSMNVECALDAGSRRHGALSVVVEDQVASVALRIRHSDANFFSPFGASLSEFSQLSNEEGIFCGIMIHPCTWLRLQGYIDVFRSLIPRYGMSAPTRGTDLLCEAQMQVLSATSLRMRIHSDVQSDAFHAQDGTLMSAQRVKNSGRVETLQNVAEDVRIRIRLDAVCLTNELNSETESGTCISTSWDWRILPWWKCGGNYAVYSSDSFAAALYAYESSAPGTVTSTALYGDGARLAIYSQCDLSEQWHVWLRYDLKVQNGTNSYGSSMTEISGQNQSHVFMQLDYRW